VAGGVGGRELASLCWWLEGRIAGMLATVLDFLLTVLAVLVCGYRFGCWGEWRSGLCRTRRCSRPRGLTCFW
jgi:hypothetical protein